MIRKLIVDGKPFFERQLDDILVPDDLPEPLLGDEPIGTREVSIPVISTSEVNPNRVEAAVIKFEEMAGLTGKKPKGNEYLADSVPTQMIRLLEGAGADDIVLDSIIEQKKDDYKRRAIGGADIEYRAQMMEREVIAGRAIRHGDGIIFYDEVRRISHRDYEVVAVQRRMEGNDYVLIPGVYIRKTHVTGLYSEQEIDCMDVEPITVDNDRKEIERIIKEIGFRGPLQFWNPD